MLTEAEARIIRNILIQSVYTLDGLQTQEILPIDQEWYDVRNQYISIIEKMQHIIWPEDYDDGSNQTGQR